MYWSGISQEIVPLFEFMSAKHNVPTLSGFMTEFNADLKKYSGSINPVKTITLDFSFALMNAASMAFNGCNLIIYIDMVYRKFVQKRPVHCNITIIASCSVHVIKFFSDRLAQKFERFERKTVLLSFARILMSETYNDFLDNFAILYICLSKEKVPIYIAQNMFNYSLSKTNELFECIENETNVETDEFKEDENFAPK